MTGDAASEDQGASPPSTGPHLRIDLEGELVEMAPWVRDRFPKLAAQGLDHPVLKPVLGALADEEQAGGGQRRWEVEHRGQRYQVALSFDKEAGSFQVQLEAVDEAPR